MTYYIPQNWVYAQGYWYWDNRLIPVTVKKRRKYVKASK